MIRSESEYKEAVRRLKEQDGLLSEQKHKLEERNLGEDEVQRAMDPLRSFRQQLAEEVESYARLKRGEFDQIRNLRVDFWGSWGSESRQDFRGIAAIRNSWRVSLPQN